MKPAIGFDNEAYLRTQSARIKERISTFGDKLYLEFGGKLFDDFHASRVLPGFQPDSKIRMLTQLKDEAECQEYIAELDARKLYSTGVDIKPSDKLLTLSTCSYDFNEERLVVVGRLVRDGEDKTVDTSKAVANNKPRYPAKYYQKKGLTDPFATAAKWIPNA